MRDSNLDLFAHLMRRAGFGANRDELEVMAAGATSRWSKTSSTRSASPR